MTIKKGCRVIAKITRVEEQHIKCRLNNDLEASLWIKDIYDDDSPAQINEMQMKFRDLPSIEARVKHINESLFKVDLIMKKEALDYHSDPTPGKFTILPSKAMDT